MSEQALVSLAELAAPRANSLATGPFGSAVSAKNFRSSGVPLIRGSNLSTDVGVRLRDDDMVFLDEEKATRFSRSQAVAGDLVFTCWGTIGQVGLIDSRSRYDRYIVSNKQMKLSPNPALADSLFLYYALSSPQIQQTMQAIAIGSSVPGFNLGQLRDLKIPVPPLEKQRAVAEVLGALDDKIDNCYRIASLADQIFHAEWENRFGELQTNPDLLLRDLCSAQYGFTASATTDPVGPKFLRVMDINKTNWVDWAAVPYCAAEDDARSRYGLRQGDIVVARMADPGKAALVEEAV